MFYRHGDNIVEVDSADALALAEQILGGKAVEIKEPNKGDLVRRIERAGEPLEPEDGNGTGEAKVGPIPEWKDAVRLNDTIYRY